MPRSGEGASSTIPTEGGALAVPPPREPDLPPGMPGEPDVIDPDDPDFPEPQEPDIVDPSIDDPDRDPLLPVP
jgi:hypothetical protein